MTEADEKVKVVLAEYNALRSEIIQKFQLHLQIYTIVFSALMLLIGFIFINKIYDLLLVIPLFASILLYRWIWEQELIKLLSIYLNDLEENKIPALIGHFDVTKENFQKYWMGWQHFYIENSPPKKYYKYSFNLLIAITFGLPITFNILAILSIYGYINIITHIPFILHLLAILINSSLAFHIYSSMKRIYKMSTPWNRM